MEWRRVLIHNGEPISKSNCRSSHLQPISSADPRVMQIIATSLLTVSQSRLWIGRWTLTNQLVAWKSNSWWYSPFVFLKKVMMMFWREKTMLGTPHSVESFNGNEKNFTRPFLESRCQGANWCWEFKNQNLFFFCGSWLTWLWFSQKINRF